MSRVNTNVKLSKAAVTSLVLGMLVGVPLCPGALAVVFGMWAIGSIRESGGALVGRRIAISGIGLGVCQVLGWVFVLLSGFVVQPWETAVVVDRDEATRTVGRGLNFKIPIVESAYLFPTQRIFETRTDSLLVAIDSHRQINVNARLLWRVCDPRQWYKSEGGEFSEDKSSNRLRIVVRRQLSRAGLFLKEGDPNWFDSEYPYELAKQVNTSVKRFGLCVTRLDLEHVK